MEKRLFHKDFMLNGNSFNSVESLMKYVSKEAQSASKFLADWFNDSDHIEIGTSGSTGKPKIIKIRKDHMHNSALMTGRYFSLPARTTALLCLSTDFIAGQMMLVRALHLGWHLDLVEPSVNPLEHIDKSYDFSAMVPLQVANGLDKLGQLKKLIVGGGVVSKTLQEQLQGQATEIFTTYGMTETSTHVAVRKLNSIEYEVLPNISISKDQRGCLVIDAPELTDAQIVTNDLVEITSESKFKWLGRYDTIINSGGVKLIPEKIEEKLSGIITNRFFVAGIPDEVLGEKLILLIESKENDTLSLIEIKEKAQLEKYEAPKAVYFVEKFVETKTKKIQRQKTLDLLFDTRS